MRGRTLLFIVIIGLVAMVVPSTRGDWVYYQQDYSGTLNVSPLTYRHLSAYRTTGYREYIDFDVTAGGNLDIDFFIVDSENFQNMENGYSFTAYNIQDRVTTYSGYFEFPYADTWYFVFDNTFSIITTKTVQVQMDLYQWQDPTTPPGTTPTTPGGYYGLPPSTIGLIAGLVIVVIVVVAIVVTYALRRREPAVTSEPSESTSGVRHCVHCGALLAGNERFCGECGSSV